MDAADYDVQELARAAGVTPRTVRYYVREKLLAKPGTRGPGTRYPRIALDQLRLIKQLQHEGWPLAKIRERLEALGEEGVRAAAESSVARPSTGAAPARRALERSTWERIKLTPSVEVNFRRPLTSTPKVDKLVRAALEIFGDEP